MQPAMSRMRSTPAGNVRKKSSFLRIVTTPYRALCRARDIYVRSVTRCGQPPSFAPSKSKSKLPRSFSAASSSSSTVVLENNNEDYRELVRAASVRTLRESNIIIDQQAAEAMNMIYPKSVRRSVSVGIGMGRIDEEAPFEVVEGSVVAPGDETTWQSGLLVGSSIRKKMKTRGDLLYPRSKSYAEVVNNQNVAF